MQPEDPRHGTYAGASAHWKAGESPCDACSTAAWRRRKRNSYLAAIGRPATVPKHGLVRRVHALQAIGWTQPQIAAAAGLSIKTLRNPLLRGSTAYRCTHEAVAEAFERLCMTLPPETTPQQRRDAAYARTVAARNGWAPPLAWDDIDDPDERPKVGTQDDRRDAIDPVTVDRLLAGQHVPSTPTEKREAMRRWLAAGRSERSLCVAHGWNEGRYTNAEGRAA
jgi:hypothetical protein